MRETDIFKQRSVLMEHVRACFELIDVGDRLCVRNERRARENSSLREARVCVLVFFFLLSVHTR